MDKQPVILAVDDEVGALKSLEMILKDTCQVLMAESGKQAVAILKQQPVDFVITDIHMPDMTGIDVLHQSKELDSTREVLIVTGFANLDTAKAALRLGAQDYIHKPYHAEEILTNVKKGIEKREKSLKALKQLEVLSREKEDLENILSNAEKNDSLNELSFGVVHEINNPLTVIQSYVDMILKKINENNGSLNEKKYQDYLKTVEGQIQQCRVIAMEFLNFAREGNIEQKQLDLKLMLEDLIEMYRANPMGRCVEFKLECKNEIPEIKLSIGLIRQVFVNMIVNAIHAMDSKGKLIITLEQKQNGVEIQFADTGKGIPEENLDKIFETFFTTKEGGKGSGLGLSISKKIVQRHGGHIGVQSTLGKGSTFKIYLPLQVPVQNREPLAS